MQNFDGFSSRQIIKLRINHDEQNYLWFSSLLNFDFNEATGFIKLALSLLANSIGGNCF